MKLSVIGLFVIVSFYFARSQICQIENVRQCEDFPLVQRIDFHAFIPTQMLDTMCQRLQSAISCVYTNGSLNYCVPSISQPFDTQRGVIKAVCGDRREEYLRSGKCFTANGVKTRIDKDCMSILANYTLLSRAPCRTIMSVTECARTNILMTDRCNAIDANLMADLLQMYLQPTRDIFMCPKSGRWTDGAAKQKNIRDKTKNNSIYTTLTTKSTSQEPQLEKTINIHKKSDGELSPKSVTTKSKQETQRTMPQSFHVKINDEDINDPQTLLQTAPSDINKEMREEIKDSGPDSLTSSHQPLMQKLKDATSSHQAIMQQLNDTTPHQSLMQQSRDTSSHKPLTQQSKDTTPHQSLLQQSKDATSSHPPLIQQSKYATSSHPPLIQQSKDATSSHPLLIQQSKDATSSHPPLIQQSKDETSSHTPLIQQSKDATSSHPPLIQQSKDASSSSSSSTSILKPTSSMGPEPAAANSTFKQSNLKNIVTTSKSYSIHNKTLTDSIGLHESKDTNQPIWNQTRVSSVTPSDNIIEVHARAAMSTQGSSVRVNLSTLLQAYLFFLNIILPF